MPTARTLEQSDAIEIALLFDQFRQTFAAIDTMPVEALPEAIDILEKSIALNLAMTGKTPEGFESFRAYLLAQYKAKVS